MSAEEHLTILMGQPNPLISVLMATYNRECYIRAALESILQQAYAPIELIVIDDGSTDGTPAVIHSLLADARASIRYVQQPNRGQAVALNHGLRLARGSVIAFLDSDDLWPPARLPAQLAYFDQGMAPAAPPVGIVLGRKERFADGVAVNPGELAAANQRPVHYSLGAALIARWVFDVVGLFDKEMRHNADWDWFVRARDLGIAMIADPRVTVLGRIHGANITQDRKQGGQQTAKMLRNHLARQRTQQAATHPQQDGAPPHQLLQPEKEREIAQ